MRLTFASLHLLLNALVIPVQLVFNLPPRFQNGRPTSRHTSFVSGNLSPQGINWNTSAVSSLVLRISNMSLP
eukprot:scaffold950_cov77-Skeletonema_marinoi.AAC.2